MKEATGIGKATHFFVKKNLIQKTNANFPIERTALMAAAAKGQEKVLKLLIARNAALDLKSKTDYGCDIGGEYDCTEVLAYGVT